jgi:hypothetical protein
MSRCSLTLRVLSMQCGQPCRKQPCTKTQARLPWNTMSGLPGRPRRCSRNRRPCRWRKRRTARSGEVFEDLLTILLNRVSKIPNEKLALRSRVSEPPGFRRAPVRQKGERRKGEPSGRCGKTEKRSSSQNTTRFKWTKSNLLNSAYINYERILYCPATPCRASDSRRNGRIHLPQYPSR